MKATSSNKFTIFRPIRHQRWPPWTPISWHNIKNLTRSKSSMSSTEVKFIGQMKMAALDSDLLIHIRLLDCYQYIQKIRNKQKACTQCLPWSYRLDGPSHSQEKKKEIWLSPVTKTSTPTEQSKKATWQHRNATKNFDYTTVADRLRTVSWSDSSHPTGVVKPVYERSTFPLAAKVVQSIVHGTVEILL